MIAAAHFSIVLTASVLFVVTLAISRHPDVVGAMLIVLPIQIAAHIVAQIALT